MDEPREDRESQARESAVRKEPPHRGEAVQREEGSSEYRKSSTVVEEGAEESKKAKAEVEGKSLSKSPLSSDRESETGASAPEESKKSTEKTDKRDRLFPLLGAGENVDQEKLGALSLGQKLSVERKNGETDVSAAVAKKAEAGDLKAQAEAIEAAKKIKVTVNEGGASTRRGLDPGTVGKEGVASDLGPREIPRRSSQGEGNGEDGKGTVPKNDGENEKESRKAAIRTTVVNRDRNARQSDEGGGQKSGLQDSSGRSEVRFVGESSDSGRTESTGFETGRPSLTPAARTGNSSALEGGRDLAPRHLQQQLKEFATGDVVRHARFVLKENAGGEIRLLLKPEQLGTVRVRLEVQDNRIAGRIIVENTTVRDAFEQTLSELQRAFREAGLETGSLEVTVGQDGQASGQRPATQGRRARAVEELAESVPRIIGELEEPRMINVYA